MMKFMTDLWRECTIWAVFFTYPEQGEWMIKRSEETAI